MSPRNRRRGYTTAAGAEFQFACGCVSPVRAEPARISSTVSGLEFAAETACARRAEDIPTIIATLIVIRVASTIKARVPTQSEALEAIGVAAAAVRRRVGPLGPPLAMAMTIASELLHPLRT